jgi:OmpA-OmpF porin, OOP family
MKFRTTLAAAAVLALPVVAKAQPLTGLYVGGGLGANIMLNEKIKPSFPGSNTDLTPKVGPAVDLTIGFQAPFGLRAEVEGVYRYNTFSGSRIGGQEQKFGPMFNVLYDIVGLPIPFQPYVGVGVGYQWVQERGVRSAGPFAQTTLNQGTMGSIAYQGIIGGALAVTPNLALTVDYRFMGLASQRHYSANNRLVPTGAVVPAGANLSNDYNNTVMVGFRYTFGSTAPAPVAPAPAAVPASPVSRSYLVFFDWDKAVLTDRAKQIVSEAAANSKKVQTTRIEVNGYTDTSGTPRYNQGLSVRRAQAVAAELVRDGVPQSEIAIQGFGDTHLLVATGPGVREPQNRRVEIIIR